MSKPHVKTKNYIIRPAQRDTKLLTFELYLFLL